jgi:hypothetical protein
LLTFFGEAKKVSALPGAYPGFLSQHQNCGKFRPKLKQKMRSMSKFSPKTRRKTTHTTIQSMHCSNRRQGPSNSLLARRCIQKCSRHIGATSNHSSHEHR